MTKLYICLNIFGNLFHGHKHDQMSIQSGEETVINTVKSLAPLYKSCSLSSIIDR